MSITTLASAQAVVSSGSRARPMFFVVSVRKLTLMTCFTFGLYGLFWFYRNWELYQEASGVKVNMLLRCALPELFIYSLLSRVDRQIRATGRQYAWSPWCLTFSLVLATLVFLQLSMLMPPMLGEMPLIVLVAVLGVVMSCWVLGRIQRAINFCEGDPEGAGNGRFTLVNGVWVGGIVLIGIGAGIR